MGIRKEAWSDLLKRYLTVWRNVWAVRKELEPPKRDRHERDFLPAHLELTETPVSPLPKWTARLIMLFAVLALVWAWFGQLDIVAIAQGKTEPGGQSKVIQPLETAEVKVIHVRDGQHVEAGETLLELRAVGSDADVIQSEKALHAAQLAKWRNEALLAALDHNRPPQMNKAAALQAGIDEADFLQAQLLVSNQYQAWAAQDQQIGARIRQHEAEARVVNAEIDKLANLGSIESKRTSDLNKLVKQNFISNHAYLEQKSKLIENQNDLKSKRNQREQIKAAIDEAKDSRAVNTQTIRRDTLDALRQADEQSAQLRAQLDKAQQRQRLMRLAATTGDAYHRRRGNCGATALGHRPRRLPAERQSAHPQQRHRLRPPGTRSRYQNRSLPLHPLWLPHRQSTNHQLRRYRKRTTRPRLCRDHRA